MLHPTLREPIRFPPQHGLSELDKAYLTLCYPHVKEPEAKSGDWSLYQALSIAGVNGAAYERISKMSNPDSIRQLFIEWNEDFSIRLARGLKK